MKPLQHCAFAREIGGKVIIGNVKEKEKAKTDYDAAMSRGESAGYIEQ